VLLKASAFPESIFPSGSWEGEVIASVLQFRKRVSFRYLFKKASCKRESRSHEKRCVEGPRGAKFEASRKNSEWQESHESGFSAF